MEKRSMYIKKFEEKLVEYNEKLAKMEAKVAEAQGDMKAEYLSQIESLENTRNDFLAKYGELKDSSEHAWSDVKAGTEKAWHELSDSIEKAVSHFK